MGEAALIQIVAQVIGELFHGKAPGFIKAVHVQGLAVVPPGHNRGEVLQLHGLGLGEVLVALGYVQTVKPGFLRGAAAVKEQDVRGDGGIGGENAAGHADDGVEIELRQQFFLDVDLGVVGAEEEAVGQDHRRAAVLLQPVHDDGHEEVGGLGAGQISGEMVLDLCLFAAAVRGIHEDHVKAVVVGVVQHVLQQGVVVIDPGHVQPVQQQVRDAEHIGKLLLFDAVDGGAVLLGVRRALDLRLQLLEPAGDEAAGAAGKVRHGLPDPGTHTLRHELRHRAGRIELTGAASTLQLFQDGLVDLPEGVALLIVGEIQLVDDVEHLPQQHAVLHVLVGVGKGGLHDGLLDGRLRRDRDAMDQDVSVTVGDVPAFKYREQGVVDEIQERVTGQALAGLVMGPVAPAAGLRDDGDIVVLIKFPVLLLGVVDFQKQHPCNLLEPLRVAVDARVVAHDVPQALYKAG